MEKLGEYLPEVVRVPISETETEAKNNILVQLQHYGAATNLIDFTTDYLVALFFACEKEDSQDGRILLLKRERENKERENKERENKDYDVIKALRTIDRVESQKSIFVQSRKGFIEPDHEVTIPHDLKSLILIYLKKHHDISRERIYNDIHGFIKSADIKLHRLEYHTAEQLKKKWEGDREKDPEALNKAVDHCQRALKIESKFHGTYVLLAQIYFLKEEYKHSIENYSKAIELSPDDAELYSYRGKAYYHDDDYDCAIRDYNKAIELDENYASYYYERCVIFIKRREWEKVRSDISNLNRLVNEQTLLTQLAKFARQEEINLPEDIQEMLESTDG